MNEAELGFELKNALARIEALEAALRTIAATPIVSPLSAAELMKRKARAALAPEQDK